MIKKVYILNKDDLLKIKQNLKDHILECNEILALLDADSLNKDQKLKILLHRLNT